MRVRPWLWFALGGALLLGLSRTRIGAAVIDRARATLAELIDREEGLRLTAYQDFAGYWTIGYGHRIQPGEPYGPGSTITKAEALQLLERDTQRATDAVQRAVTVPLNANQLAALTSLAYNIGTTAFASSTLVRRLNAGDVAGAREEFSRWINAAGKPSSILAGRRAREAQLFATPEVVA